MTEPPATMLPAANEDERPAGPFADLFRDATGRDLLPGDLHPYRTPAFLAECRALAAQGHADDR